MPPKVSKHSTEDLNAFARTVWGSAEAVLKLDAHTGVQYIDLTLFPRAFRLLIASDIPRILVRQEYITALHELETSPTYSRAAYVTGQPGIGKTFFLVYILVARLGNRCPVTWELTNGLPFYILFSDSATFHGLDDLETLEDFGPLWALSDSNDQVRSPKAIFYNFPSLVRTIQSTSPREHRWKEWSKQAGAECYIMDIWSENEIADLAKLLHLDADRMTTLARLWGGVPRQLLRFLRMPEHRIEREYRAVAEVAVQKCRTALTATVGMDILEQGPSKFYFCRPAETEFGIDRMLASPSVPTPTLRHLLGEALRRQDNAVKLNFFRALSQPSETRSAAGCIFESWFHIYMSAAKPIQCHWVQGLDSVTTLTGTDTLIPSTWAAVKVAVPPYYWPAPKHCPGIDSALVLDGVIYAFQVTISPQHKTPYDGLQKLRGHLPAELKGLPWRVVFIGDDDDTIAAVAGSWVGKLTSPTGQAATIGWCKVNPVMNVTYREIREESDPDDVSMEDATE